MQILRFSTLFVIGILAAHWSGSSLSAGELEGKWREGSWYDANSGHKDVLRARFRQKRDGNYRVVFTGRFAKVVPFRFATTLKVAGHDGDKVVLAGESRIAGFMKFSYHGAADAHHFHADYHSRRWSGEFNLYR